MLSFSTHVTYLRVPAHWPTTNHNNARKTNKQRNNKLKLSKNQTKPNKRKARPCTQITRHPRKPTGKSAWQEIHTMHRHPCTQITQYPNRQPLTWLLPVGIRTVVRMAWYHWMKSHEQPPTGKRCDNQQRCRLLIFKVGESPRSGNTSAAKYFGYLRI